jgi:hypothetical protein
LIRGGAIKPLRLAESVQTAATTGAYETIWEILRHALPAPLADLAPTEPAPLTDPAAGTDAADARPAGAPVPARGLGDLLAVAAECAERTGARGELPHLSGTAERRGSSRLVVQARRLRNALTERAAA